MKLLEINKLLRYITMFISFIVKHSQPYISLIDEELVLICIYIHLNPNDDRNITKVKRHNTKLNDKKGSFIFEL